MLFYNSLLYKTHSAEAKKEDCMENRLAPSCSFRLLQRTRTDCALNKSSGNIRAYSARSINNQLNISFAWRHTRSYAMRIALTFHFPRQEKNGTWRKSNWKIMVGNIIKCKEDPRSYYYCCNIIVDIGRTD